MNVSRSDMMACRELLKDGSRSFYAASHLLPLPMRDAAVALYAFCRLADDAIDEGDDPQAALIDLHQRLLDIYRQQPCDHPVDRAFAATVAEHRLPQALPAALLEGFAWDCERRRYPTLESVIAYSARVAGTVGVMMSVLMGVRDARVLARAADLGVAMQLTNICRDVGEDARAGRLYLPENWLLEAGVDPQRFLANPQCCDGVASVVARLLDLAERLYTRSDAGLPRLPRRFRAGMYAARLLYAGIGEVVAGNGYNSVNQRAYVTRAGKLQLLSGLPKVTALSTDDLSLPSLAETRFLIDAVAATPIPLPATPLPVGSRAYRFLSLIEELERRDREHQSGPGIDVTA